MIALKFSNSNGTIEREFSDSEFFIGSQTMELSELKENTSSLEEKHLLFKTSNNKFVVINQANDPYASYNGVPFGKKTLKTDDSISIGSITISCLSTPASSSKATPIPTYQKTEKRSSPNSAEEISFPKDSNLDEEQVHSLLTQLKHLAKYPNIA